jgi:hypothetical protein
MGIQRTGLTFLELMICVVILATALMTMLGQMVPLSKLQKDIDERTKAIAIAKVMAERLQGAPWFTLGTEEHPWSWHRREVPDATYGNPPLTEEDTSDSNRNNLLFLGVLPERSGLQNLRVFVEYYDMAIMSVSTTHATWETARQSATYVLPESYKLSDAPENINLADETDAVVFRVLVTWDALGGSPQRHDLVLARRR